MANTPSATASATNAPVFEFGAHILEILTTGMYENPLVILREYIQNSCDAIDEAIRQGILRESTGKISIDIDENQRIITFEDNGTGIPEQDFKPIMCSIAASQKNSATNLGFRGIGRLCGVAYCKQLHFVSKAKGEEIESIMIIDAEAMRTMFYSGKNYTAQDVLKRTITFGVNRPVALNDHYFRVELIDVVPRSKLLEIGEVRNYLAFTVPVEYRKDSFGDFEDKIYAHADKLGFKINEYAMFLNGRKIVKPYTKKFKAYNSEDDIFALDFQDFRDEAGNLIAWSWVGISTFKGVISSAKGTNDALMRGIRLRAGNIQIGNEMVFQKLFEKDPGTTYFIGEVHAVDKNLIPNARRDYFVSNDTLTDFEKKLETYFATLIKIVRKASDIRSAFKNNKSTAIKKLRLEAEAYSDEFRGVLLQIFYHIEKASKAATSPQPTTIQPTPPQSTPAQSITATDNVTDSADDVTDSTDDATDSADNATDSADNATDSADDTTIQSTTITIQSTTVEVINELPPPPIRLPSENWSLDKQNLYSDICEIVINNPKLSGAELIRKFEEVLG